MSIFNSSNWDILFLLSKTVDARLSGLDFFNKFLIEQNLQDQAVINDSDIIKIQANYANPTDINKAERK